MDLLVCCAAAVPDVDEVDCQLIEWRQRSGRAANYEFHGHRCTESELLWAMEYLLNVGRVAAVLVDKRQMLEDLGPRPSDSPGKLYPALARPLLEMLMESGPLKTLWCDIDIPLLLRGAFESSIQRSPWSTTNYSYPTPPGS